MSNYQLDSIDQKILSFLVKNARMPFLEIARECNVSGAAIHQRVKRLEANGVITGSRLLVKPQALGLNVCAYVSVSLSEANKYPEVIEAFKKISEVVECHFVTGKHNLLIKIPTHKQGDEHTAYRQEYIGRYVIEEVEECHAKELEAIERSERQCTEHTHRRACYGDDGSCLAAGHGELLGDVGGDHLVHGDGRGKSSHYQQEVEKHRHDIREDRHGAKGLLEHVGHGDEKQ